MDTGYGYGRNVRIHKRSHGRNRSIGERPGSFHASPLRAVYAPAIHFVSALPPSAAATIADRGGSYGPEAVSSTAANSLIRSPRLRAKEREWNREAKRFGSFEIDV